jgi:hypothetical protein
MENRKGKKFILETCWVFAKDKFLPYLCNEKPKAKTFIFIYIKKKWLVFTEENSCAMKNQNSYYFAEIIDN